MKYYRSRGIYYDYFNNNGVVPNELLTEKERNSKVRYISDDKFEIVDISEKNTYFSFGVRFECGWGVNGKLESEVK